MLGPIPFLFEGSGGWAEKSSFLIGYSGTFDRGPSKTGKRTDAGSSPRLLLPRRTEKWLSVCSRRMLQPISLRTTIRSPVSFPPPAPTRPPRLRLRGGLCCHRGDGDTDGLLSPNTHCSFSRWLTCCHAYYQSFRQEPRFQYEKGETDPTPPMILCLRSVCNGPLSIEI